MSDAAEAARVSMMLADFAIVDAAGKLNIIGGGVNLLGYDPAQGLTSRFALVVEIWIPSKFCPVDLPCDIALRTSDGAVVELPGPAEPQKMRVGQVITVEPPIVQGSVPRHERDGLEGRATYLLDFSSGLPLQPGHAYLWEVQLDGSDPIHAHPFAVPGGGSNPVVG